MVMRNRGRSGMASNNLNQWQVVQSQPYNLGPSSMQSVTTSGSGFINQPFPNQPIFTNTSPHVDPNRLFHPIHSPNMYVHPDDHIQWLKGRTRSVCARVHWSKSQFSY